MEDSKTTISELKKLVSKMVKDREWERFHTPSNLAKSIIIEAAELLEKFQWTDWDESKRILGKEKHEIEDEISDIVAYLFSLCNLYNIDLSSSFKRKMKKNLLKYPIEKCKGKSGKYTRYQK